MAIPLDARFYKRHLQFVLQVVQILLTLFGHVHEKRQVTSGSRICRTQSLKLVNLEHGLQKVDVNWVWEPAACNLCHAHLRNIVPPPKQGRAMALSIEPRANTPFIAGEVLILKSLHKRIQLHPSCVQ
ncbi:hypothetical protein BCR44DRAFT_1434131 [Catenaria anguillulae PL171]|uniref:Uncharacterized protein n=1 Tax=Catenaria anguillulae PL171 TaxID=765915 RepID=A0A1Y2HLF2_9FUNG|nr:hypothetical protein BCR44DRAFT_1434131 [Catenaria anguillulae PL171]